MAFATGAAVLPGTALIRDALGASTKTPKSAVQYRNKPKNGKMCSKCMFYIPGKSNSAKGKCQVVQGAIDPQGWCMLFTPKQQ
jgi:hypothetical protein